MLLSRSVCSISAFILVSSSACLSGQRPRYFNRTEHTVSVYAIGSYTSVSPGKFNNGSSILQSNKAVLGAAAYLATWKRSNGLIVGESYTNTQAELMNLHRVIDDTWKLQRFKTDLVYEHRFFTGRTFEPHLGVGGFLMILWGGNAPAHSGVNASGWDSLTGLIVPLGMTTRLNSRVSLKTGLFVDIGKASTYGDTTYRASRNIMYEPQIGLSFRVGKRRGPEE
jgi:hypothetical protein